MSFEEKCDKIALAIGVIAVWTVVFMVINSIYLEIC